MDDLLFLLVLPTRTLAPFQFVPVLVEDDDDNKRDLDFLIRKGDCGEGSFGASYKRERLCDNNIWEVWSNCGTYMP